MAKAVEERQTATLRIAQLQETLIANKAAMAEASNREGGAVRVIQPQQQAAIEEALDDDNEDDSTLAARISALQNSLGQLQTKRERKTANSGAVGSAKRSADQALANPRSGGPNTDKDGDLELIAAAEAADAASEAAASHPSQKPRHT